MSSTLVQQPQSLTCAACGKTVNAKPTKKGNARLPKSREGQWKRREECVYCPACWAKMYRLVCVTFPVQECLDGEWSEFTAAVRASCRETARLSNWATIQLLKAEQTPTAKDAKGNDKLPKAETVYLYGDLPEFPRIGEWEGAKASAQAVLQATQKKYNEKRFEAVHLMHASLPTVRDTCPYPVIPEAAKLSWHETEGEAGKSGKAPAISLPLGGRRWLIRLRGGPEMARQVRAFGQLVTGEAIAGEAAVYFRRREGTHRNGSRAKSPGGGNGFSVRYFVKLVAWVPREERTHRRNGGTLLVTTARNALLLARRSEGAEPWVLYADALRRRIHGYGVKLERLANDTKHERRRPRRAKRRLNGYYDRIAQRQHDYIDKELRRIAAMLVAYAVRSHSRAIHYDDASHAYCPGLPWAKLWSYIAARAEKDGVEVQSASVAVMKDDDGPESAANTESN